jgi:hypothetical protein
MCGRIGVPYSTESSEAVEGAWFLTTVGRNRVNIEAWSNGGHVGGRGVSQPLGSYGVNLTHEEAYDRLWFADRILTEHLVSQVEKIPAGLKVRGVGEGLSGY